MWRSLAFGELSIPPEKTYFSSLIVAAPPSVRSTRLLRWRCSPLIRSMLRFGNGCGQAGSANPPKNVPSFSGNAPARLHRRNLKEFGNCRCAIAATRPFESTVMYSGAPQ
jgi:hypothetical protein